MSLRLVHESRFRAGHFDTLRPSADFIVRPAHPVELPGLFAFAQERTPDLAADMFSIRRVHSRDANSILVLQRGVELAGVYASLFLKASGLEKLLLGEFEFDRPSPDDLCRPGETVAGAYIWLYCAPGAAREATGNVAAFLQAPRFAKANIFACAATESGRRWMERVGFERIACGAGNLWRCRRQVSEPAAFDWFHDANPGGF